MIRDKIIADAPALSAMANISLGSAIVPDIPPLEISAMPNTRFARFKSIILNCSCNSKRSVSQLTFKIPCTSPEVQPLAVVKV